VVALEFEASNETTPVPKKANERKSKILISFLPFSSAFGIFGGRNLQNG